MAAAGAREGGVGGGGEHLGEAVFAEAVSALEEERDSLVLVVPSVAHGTARDLHLLRRPDHLERKALKIIIGKIRERERVEGSVKNLNHFEEREERVTLEHNDNKETN